MDYQDEIAKEQHENWIRHHCVQQSMQINKGKPIKKIISDAKQISQFIISSKKTKLVDITEFMKK